MALPPIGMLWIGGPMSFLDILCVQSFRDAGHEVNFYTYGDVPNIPDGVNVLEARDILAGPPFLRHVRSGSLAFHADLFRLRLLAAVPGIIWADTDAYCVKPFETSTGHFYALQAPASVATGVLALPPDSPTLKKLLEFTADPFAIPPWLNPVDHKSYSDAAENGTPVHVTDQAWGVWGPQAVTHFLNETGEIKYALPSDTLYPISFQARNLLLRRPMVSEELMTENTVSIHFYSSRLRRFILRRHDGIPPFRSLIGQLLAKHGIDPKDAPLPPEDQSAE